VLPRYVHFLTVLYSIRMTLGIMPYYYYLCPQKYENMNLLMITVVFFEPLIFSAVYFDCVS